MTEQKLNCVGDNILITLPEVKEKTEAGIIKSDEMLAEEASKVDSHITTVISIGENVQNVKVGDKIMINNTQVPIFTINGVRYGGIKAYDVFCIVEEITSTKGGKA
jgi:co-chaperonin GroES (HSP10)